MITKEQILAWRDVFEDHLKYNVFEISEAARMKMEICDLALKALQPEERQGSIPPCVPTQDGEGVHEWVSGDNPVVKGIEVCVKCLALRPAQSQPQKEQG